MIKLFRKKIKGLKSNLFFQNIAIVSSGPVIGRIIGFAVAPIITRLYTPSDYGLLSVFTAIVGIGGTLSTLRYAVTIPLPKKNNEADDLLKLSFIIAFLLSIILTLVIVFFGEYLTLKFSIQKINPYLWVLPISFFGLGIYEALTFWATRHKYFKTITKTKITQSVSSSIIKIGFGLLGVTPLGLLLGQIASKTAGIESLFRKLVKNSPTFFYQFTWTSIKQLAIRYKRFPLYQSWSQVLLGFGTHLPVLFVASIYGSTVVGLYGLAHGIISLPMGLLGNSVSQVFYAEIAKYGKTQKHKIYKLSLSIIKNLFSVSIIPVIILFVAGPHLFELIFGDEWFYAGTYARALSIIILFRLISSPIMQCLNVLEKQNIQLLLNVIRTTLVIAVFFFAKTANLEPIRAVYLYSMTLSLFYLSTMIYTLKLLKT